MHTNSVRKINDTKYRIRVTEGTSYIKVRISDAERFTGVDIYSNTYYKKRWVLFGEQVMSVDEAVSDALNEAVCKYEGKNDRKEEFESVIDRSIDVVKEVHESDQL